MCFILMILRDCAVLLVTMNLRSGKDSFVLGYLTPILATLVQANIGNIKPGYVYGVFEEDSQIES